MKAALEKHRLSTLALGHKHRYGIDGVPQDLEASFGKLPSVYIWKQIHVYSSKIFKGHYIIFHLSQCLGTQIKPIFNGHPKGHRIFVSFALF